MANFCYDCAQKIYPGAKPEDNDMAHGKQGEYIRDICEECGEGWFDWQGKRSEGIPYTVPAARSKGMIERLRDWVKSYRL